MEYASNAKGNLGVTLGAIGTGLSALSGNGILSNWFGGNNGYNNCNGRNNGYGCGNGNNYGYGYSDYGCGGFVSRGEARLLQDIATKDSQIALLSAESNTENKMIEVYKQAHSEIVNLRENTDRDLREIRREIDTNRREQDAWNASQSVANARISAAIAANENSILSLRHVIDDITMIKVPNRAVCPGWGDITVTPVEPAAPTT